MSSYREYSNTKFERLALARRINFSDGHARHELTCKQQEIVNDSLDRFKCSTIVDQHDIEREFLSAFLQCAGEPCEQSNQPPLLSYSASSSIKIVAQFLARRHRKIYLVEPCFDNIRLLLRSAGIEVHPLPELALIDIDNLHAHVEAGIPIWITLPNNPTGFRLDRVQFEKLAQFAHNSRSLLVFDFCFRFYSRTLCEYSQYHVLKDANCDFIAIEDTGKTWPVYDLKSGITFASEVFVSELEEIHQELLLNVSPFILSLLTELIMEANDTGLDVSVRGKIARNRRSAARLLENARFRSAMTHSDDVPLLLLELTDGTEAVEFWRLLRTSTNVDVLPAKNYWWGKDEDGFTKFRISLSRPNHQFDEGVSRIQQFVDS